jgi:RNA recognition motif-containing protein
VEDDDEEEDDDEDAPGVDGVDKTANGTVQKRKRKKKQKKSKGPNNWIYISGLPADVSLEEIRDHFSKVCSCTVLHFSALF